MSNITDMIAEGHVIFGYASDAEKQDNYAEMFGGKVGKAVESYYKNGVKSYDTDEVITNKDGGKQSKIHGRFDLIPGTAISEVAAVLDHGAERYGERNWEKISVNDHINHALQHIFAMLRGQYNGYGTDLSHATTRLLFALDLYLREMDNSDEF